MDVNWIGLSWIISHITCILLKEKELWHFSLPLYVVKSFPAHLNFINLLCLWTDCSVLLYPPLFSLSHIFVPAWNTSIVLRLFWHSALSSNKSNNYRGRFFASFLRRVFIWNMSQECLPRVQHGISHPTIHHAISLHPQLIWGIFLGGCQYSLERSSQGKFLSWSCKVLFSCLLKCASASCNNCDLRATKRCLRLHSIYWISQLQGSDVCFFCCLPFSVFLLTGGYFTNDLIKGK